jgi:hypothetical protein
LLALVARLVVLVRPLVQREALAGLPVLRAAPGLLVLGPLAAACWVRLVPLLGLRARLMQCCQRSSLVARLRLLLLR